MKIPAILLSKEALKKIAKKKLETALEMIEDSLEMAELPERTAFELKVAARYAKEDLNVASHIIQSQKSKQSIAEA